MRMLIIMSTMALVAFDPGWVFAGCSGRGNGGNGKSPTADLTCRGACEGSSCDQHQMENPPGCFYMVCSCSSTSESDCCHLILKLTGDMGSPDGWDTGGDCPSCETTGSCGWQSMGDDTQAVCTQSGIG